jgi:hypothetical protein
MKKGLTEDWIEMIWAHAIIPYIEEHFFGEPDRVSEFELKRIRARVAKGAIANENDTTAPPNQTD